jgi:hypothetical protein
MVVLLFGVGCFSLGSTLGTSEGLFEELRSKWLKQEDNTASVNMRYLLIECRPSRLTRELLLSYLADAQLSEKSKGIYELSDQIAKLSDKDGSRCRVRRMEIWQEGQNVREERLGEGDRVGLVQVEVGDKAGMHIRNARQITIDIAGSMSLPATADLDWYRGNHSFQADQVRDVHLGPEGTVVLSTGKQSGNHSRLVFDRSTALLRERTSFAADGSIRSECFQSGYSHNAEGIAMPLVHVVARYRGNIVTALTVAVIESVEFNVPIPSKIFTLPAEKGVKIVDARSGEPVIVNEAVPDSLAYLDLPVVTRRELLTDSGGNQASGFGLRQMAIVANVIILIGIGLLIIIRRIVQARNIQ